MKRVVFFLISFMIASQSYSENYENLDTVFNRAAKLFKQEKYLECNDLAKCLYEKSIETTDTVLVFNSLYYIGFSNQRMGNMEEALDYNLQAYDVALLLDRLDLQSSILNNIANVYMMNDKDSLAVIYFEKSIVIERSLNRQTQLATRLGNVSTAYMKMGRCEKAISAAEEGLSIDKKVGRPNKIAIRLNQLGDVYKNCGKLKEAIQCEKEAYSYFEKAGSKYGMSIVLHSLGDMNKLENEIDSAIFYYEKSLDLANDIDNYYCPIKFKE